MPVKHNAACRPHIPRARYRVTNWPADEAGLRRRGDLTLWLEVAALDGGGRRRGGAVPAGRHSAPNWSELAVELVLALRLVFHLALRQAEAFSRSVLRLLGLALPVPDHTTLSRRGRAFAGRQPRVLASAGPLHLVLGGTGLELFGQGEWDAEEQDRARRRYQGSCRRRGPRDRPSQLMAERGRMGWQRATGYGRRNQAETGVSR